MLLTLALVACGGDCALPLDTTLYSVDDLECGLAPGGESLCRWRISFSPDGSFSWSDSDVQETGTWSCRADELTGSGTGEKPLAGSWLEDEQLLLWDGVEYEP